VLLRAQYWLYWPVMLVASRFVWHLAGVALAPKDRYLARDVGFLCGFVAYMWGLLQLVPEGCVNPNSPHPSRTLTRTHSWLRGVC
jgi:hypothetical protein